MKQTSTKPSVKWTEQVIKLGKPKSCKHIFVLNSGECKCKKCGFGLIGVLDIVDGKPV